VRGGSGILFSSSLSEVETRKKKDTADDPTATHKVSTSLNQVGMAGTPKSPVLKSDTSIN